MTAVLELTKEIGVVCEQTRLILRQLEEQNRQLQALKARMDEAPATGENKREAHIQVDAPASGSPPSHLVASESARRLEFSAMPKTASPGELHGLSTLIHVSGPQPLPPLSPLIDELNGVSTLAVGARSPQLLNQSPTADAPGLPSFFRAGSRFPFSARSAFGPYRVCRG